MRSWLLVIPPLVAAASGCPMRPNPEYEGDAASDGDVDGPSCDEDEQLCGDECVSLWDPATCGACDRSCAMASGCTCTGDPPVCRRQGGRFCYATCSPGAILCEGECLAQPDDANCGGCGVVCDSASGCECRVVEGTVGCFRLVGETWEAC